VKYKNVYISTISITVQRNMHSCFCKHIFLDVTSAIFSVRLTEKQLEKSARWCYKIAYKIIFTILRGKKNIGKKESLSVKIVKFRPNIGMNFGFI
jgi:hypothetical protein